MALAHRHQTQCLGLRPVAASDEAAVMAGCGVLAVSGWLTAGPHPFSAADFAQNDVQVTSGYFEGNTRSARVLAKLGFVETGRDVKFRPAHSADRRHLVGRLSRAAFI